jgi:hypothetical protein
VRLFSTNDYLGLSAHPAVAAAAATAAARYGMGPRASALVAGYTNHVRGLDMPSTVGLESRHLETRAKTAARLDLDVSTGWASSLSLSACSCWRRSASLHVLLGRWRRGFSASPIEF